VDPRSFRLQGKGGKGDKKADKKAERVRPRLFVIRQANVWCAPRCILRAAHCVLTCGGMYQSVICCIETPTQAAARGKQAEVPTQPDPSDPLGSQYGDVKLVRSESISGRTWTPIDTLTPELKDQQVHKDLYNTCIMNAGPCNQAFCVGKTYCNDPQPSPARQLLRLCHLHAACRLGSSASSGIGKLGRGRVMRMSGAAALPNSWDGVRPLPDCTCRRLDRL